MLATRESARGAFSSKMKNMVVRARLCAQLGISDARSASLTTSSPGGERLSSPIRWNASLGHSVFIRSEKTFTIEVYEVCGRLGDPDFSFPRDVIQVLHHSLSIKERGHENKASR